MKRQTMKTNYLLKCLGAVIVLSCAATQLHAQGRGGGGGGGGFGGFGGFGGGAGNRGFGGASSSSQYNNNGTVGTASITVDPNTHNLVIVADADTMEQIRKVVASLDVPTPQVLIKVAFVEVQDSKALDLGVQGDYTGFSKNFSKVTGYITNYTFQPSAGAGTANYTPAAVVPSGYAPVNQSYTLNNNYNLPQSLTGAAGNGGMYTIMGNDFTATLQAIATAGKAQILSRPSILARDGQMAEIVVGQSVYLPSSVSMTAVSGSSTTIPTINGSYQNVGIQLDVTPFIGANGLVQMILVPQITSIDTSTSGQVISGGSSGTLGVGAIAPVYAPNLNKRSANTVVVTPDGQPVAIGGLISNNKSSSESKIPLLGDIPILGNLFKFSSHAQQKNELLIFLTPHIVQAPSQLAAMSTHETAQAPLLTNSIPQMELDRFLDRLPVKKSAPGSSGSSGFTPVPSASNPRVQTGAQPAMQ
jgi:general secretion pathway protein D